MNLLKIFSLLLILNFNLLAQPTEPKATGNLDYSNFKNLLTMGNRLLNVNSSIEIKSIISLKDDEYFNIDQEHLHVYSLFFKLQSNSDTYTKYRIVSFNDEFLKELKKCLIASLEYDPSENGMTIWVIAKPYYPYFESFQDSQKQKYQKTFRCLASYMESEVAQIRNRNYLRLGELFNDPTVEYFFYRVENEH